MNVVVVLIVFSVLMTFVCVKARAAVPALVAGGLAVLLICSIWGGLADGIAGGAQGVGDAGSRVVSTVNSK